MSLESDLFQALGPLAGNRVYPDIAPKESALPRLTYQQVGGDAVNFLDPTVPSKKNARIQVNVWAATRQAAAALSRQVEDTLRVHTTLQVTVLGAPVALHEPDAGLFGARQDFGMWHST